MGQNMIRTGTQGEGERERGKDKERRRTTEREGEGEGEDERSSKSTAEHASTPHQMKAARAREIEWSDKSKEKTCCLIDTRLP